MNSKYIYYFSALIIGGIWFCWIKSNHANEQSKRLVIQKQVGQIEKRYRIGDFDDRLAVGEEAYSYYKKRYRHNPKKAYFACTSIRNESEQMCFSIKGDRYLLFYIEGDSISQVYSKGKVIPEFNGITTVYTFRSDAMSAYEAYYRSETFLFTGTFFMGKPPREIYDWDAVYTSDKVYEVWKLEKRFEKRDGALYDRFSNWVFKP